jgi:DNA-binding NtrC family response regulator
VDVGLLVAALVPRLAPQRADGVRFTPEAGQALVAYDWPLNTRELEHVLARALALAGDAAIGVEHLPAQWSLSKGEATAPGGTERLSERDARLRLELLEQLAQHGGNLADVARAMGKARMQVHRWCKRFGIDPNVYRR